WRDDRSRFAAARRIRISPRSPRRLMVPFSASAAALAGIFAKGGQVLLHIRAPRAVLIDGLCDGAQLDRRKTALQETNVLPIPGEQRRPTVKPHHSTQPLVNRG